MSEILNSYNQQFIWFKNKPHRPQGGLWVLDGGRGAVLLTTDAAIAKKIDKAVFPGEQGGPHVNVFAALALTFKLARFGDGIPAPSGASFTAKKSTKW